MGRRILAMLISMVLVFGVCNSPASFAYAANADEETANAEEAEGNTVEVSEGETETESDSETEDEAESETEESETIEEAEDTEESEDSEEESETEEVLEVSEVSEESAESEAESEPLSVTQNIGGLNICIDAPKGVFPKGTYAKIYELTDAGAINSIENAVAEELEDTQTITSIRVFDITMYDADGNEIQPDTSYGNVNVSIKNINTSDDMEVFHVEDSHDSVDAVDATVLSGEVCFEAEHFSSYAVVSIEDNAADPAKVIEPQALIKNLGVSVVKGGKETPLDPSTLSKISLEDKIRVTYTFNEPLIINIPSQGTYGKNPEGYDVMAGESYELPGIPEELTSTSGYSTPITKGGKRLGDITIDSAGKAVLKIDDTFSDQEKATNISAFIDLSLNLTKDKNGDKDSYELNIGGQKYNVKITDFMPQPPTVSKTASDVDSDGNVTWTVTVKNNGKPIEYEDGLTFKDTFGTGQTYVEGSLKQVGGSSITPTAANDSSITWTHKDNTASKEIQFQYKTHVDFLALTYNSNTNGSKTTKISNNIKVEAPATSDYDKLSLSQKVEKSVSKTMKNWVDKQGTTVDSNGKATWTITIRNNGFTLKNVVLHDTIVCDSDVSIAMSTPVVVDKGGNPVAYTLGGSGNAHELIFTDDMAGDAEYTVTYETTIEEYNKYLKKNHSIPKNKAWLTYDYDATGKGTTKAFKGPEIGENFKSDALIMEKAAIKKSAVKANRNNHTLEWKVEINNNKQALENVHVTECIQAGQEFVEISNVSIGGSAAPAGSYSIDTSGLPGEVVVDFGDNVKSKNASFTVITKLTDAENAVWASNNSKQYKNKAILSSDGNEDVDDTAKQTLTSEVISKTAGNYNYDTHTIHYTITTNQNKMEMNNVVVTDILKP